MEPRRRRAVSDGRAVSGFHPSLLTSTGIPLRPTETATVLERAHRQGDHVTREDLVQLLSQRLGGDLPAGDLHFVLEADLDFTKDRIVADQAFPLELKVPNSETRAAMAESREMMKQGRARFADAEAMVASLERGE